MPNETPFRLVSPHQPQGDQPQAIDALVQGVQAGSPYQTLLGVTGSGKTFTMANVIARLNRPALVLSHNKTLAAQLYEEFKELFPHNAVHYFVSYYDYYQPEAYIPQRDIYIEKDASRNDDLDRLRLAATSALVSRRDVIVVASVSCIFGLGSPDEYRKSVISLSVGQMLDRRQFLLALAQLQYNRAEVDFKRGTYRVRGDVIEIHRSDEETACRIELFGDQIESLAIIHPLTGEVLKSETQLFVNPAIHYVLPQNQVERAVAAIRAELDDRVLQLRHEGKLLEAQRIQARTKYDMELLTEVGMCPGIENYSRHLDGRPPGAKPYTLLDYFPDAPPPYPPYPPSVSSPAELQPTIPCFDRSHDWLMFIDESHVTLPQIKAMYHGDQQRKKVLVEHGFRLPSAMDNRPLRFEEVEKIWPQVVFVSATPGPYELTKTQGAIVQQIIRPTGLVDPVIEIRSASNQVNDLAQAAQERATKKQRTLVTTLTKRLAEDLANHFDKIGLKCRYLHSDIQTLDRVEILKSLREGKYDVLIGVNLLREGLDLPEVSLVAIMDADKTGFLRSPTSLIQTIGRAARNAQAMVYLYADTVTPAMKQAIDETARRRTIQLAFNQANGITPQSIHKEIRRSIELEVKANQTVRQAIRARDDGEMDQREIIRQLEAEMLQAAEALEFEKAAAIRDRIQEIQRSANPSAVPNSASDSLSPSAGMPGTKPSRRRRPGKRSPT